MNETWNNLQAELKVLTGIAKPQSAGDVFKYEENSNGVTVTVAPVTFWLKEKAKGRPAIYVTVNGELRFSPTCSKNDLRTSRFKTAVGYFREINSTKLKHVFGVHYDHEPKLPAHPVYHSQMAPMLGFVNDINSAYATKYVEVEDSVKDLMRNVRIPTAQMDVFSVFLQLAGDHLLSEASPAANMKAFDRLRSAVSIFRSDPDASPMLATATQESCFRSYHWYP